MGVQARTGGAYILVVEDSVPTRQMLALLLESAGYRVDVAQDGPTALEAAKRRRYDLVLMDLALPGMDGYAASAALQALSCPSGRMPVVALTARTGCEEAARCRTAGLDGYLTKPFQPAKLVDEIRRWTSPDAMPALRGEVGAVWDRPIYREIADLLGPARIEKALDLFEAHLLRSLEAIRAAPGDAALLAREAHALVASAGMLGFTDLSRASRRILRPDRAGVGPDRVNELEQAAERTLACLRHAPHSALA